MLQWLIELPLLPGIFLFMLLIMVAGVLIFILVHHFFVKPVYQKVHYRISRLLFRTTASLLALMLSFTYANQRVDFFTIKGSIQAEASEIVDIHMNLGFFGTPEAKQLQRELQAYVKIMLEEGWEPIVAAPFETRTFQKFKSIYGQALTLQVQNESQAGLKNEILADMDEMSDYLQVRFYKTRPETPFLFYVACFGFIVVMILFSTYTPDKIAVIFLSLYNAFIALILYFILLMNNPLVGPLKIKAEAFDILEETIERNLK